MAPATKGGRRRKAAVILAPQGAVPPQSVSRLKGRPFYGQAMGQLRLTWRSYAGPPQYYITPWAGRPSTSPKGGADPGLNPWRPGPKARRRHQPSRRSRVNLREYRQAPIPPQKPTASSIAHSKKHRSSDWCFFIIPVHAGLHGRHGHVLRDVRPPLPLQI